MKKSIAYRIPFLFCVASAIDIIGIIAHLPFLVFAAKPVLMPLLTWWLLMSKGWYGKNNRIVFTGLFFSFLGDTVLLFEDQNFFFFIGGLIFFLATHLCYILFFMSIQSSLPSLLKKQPILFFIVSFYGIALIWLLYPGLGVLQFPVIVYAVFICIMLLASIHVLLKVNKRSGYCYIAGALLFVVSDSLLAINKFYQPFSFLPVLIMLTYCAAQFLIVSGFIHQK